MAKNNNPVLLGYQDELVTEKHKGRINYMTNKIGGKADFPADYATLNRKSFCNLCGLPSRLVVQIYAPLENSLYHRTLYLFACINSSCWNRSESWQCIRIQIERTDVPVEAKAACAPKLSTTDWCTEADDWGEDDSNANLENCDSKNHVDKISDDKGSSNFDEPFARLAINERNANSEAAGSQVSQLQVPMATAEIEGVDQDIIAVETSISPRTNLGALLQETTPLPRATPEGPSSTPFVSFFMSVWPEEDQSFGDVFDHHVKELLAEYKQKDVDFLTTELCGQKKDKPGGSEGGDTAMSTEEYEKSNPLHGDKMFHHFLTKIKLNPDQVLRYNREGFPLLLCPLQEHSKRCQHCGEELAFEFQVVPTIISKLRLECDLEQCVRLEFGTVLVYTCKESCWTANDLVKDEVVFLQRETF